MLGNGNVLNLKWTLEAMDKIVELVNKGWRPDDLAWEFDATEREITALLERNGLPVHPRRKRKW